MGKDSEVETEVYPSDESSCAVIVQNVCKSYKDNQSVLSDICMHVEHGIVYGLLGSSGCGKTTLLSCIVGLKRWESGEIFVLGNHVNSDGIKGKEIGYMPQELALYEHLSVKEIITYYGKLYNMSSTIVEETWLFLVNLLKLPGGSKRICNLSGGQQRRVSLAIALIHKPKLLILDEPTVGLDPVLRKSIWNYLFNTASIHKTTIIITTHYIEEVRQSNKVGLMRNGRLLVEDDPAVLMKTYQASLLEEVVLKICRKDQDHGKNKLPDTKASTKENGVVIQIVNLTKFGPLMQDKPKNCTNADSPRAVGYLNNCLKPGESQNTVLPYETKVNNKLASEPGDGERLPNCYKNYSQSARRIAAYSHVLWINIIRHPVYILLLVLIPPIQLLTTGLVFGTEAKYSKIGLINQENRNWSLTCFEKVVTEKSDENCTDLNLSCDLIRHLSSGDSLDLIQYDTKEEAHSQVEKGNIIGYIQFPENYTGSVIDRALLKQFADNETIDASKISLHLDMSTSVTAYLILTKVFQAFQDFVSEISSACDVDLSLVQVPFFYREPVYGSFDWTSQEHSMPALIAIILVEIAFIVVPMMYINDIQLGASYRAQVAGLQFWEQMMGLSLTVAGLTVIQAIICYVLLAFGLQFTLHGSIPLYICLCLVATLCGGALGLLVGIFFEDILAVIISAIILLPVIIVNAGVLRPDEVVPHPFRDITHYAIPSLAIFGSFRSVMNRGVTFTHGTVWPGILVTLTWSLVFSLLSIFLMRRRKS